MKRLKRIFRATGRRMLGSSSVNQRKLGDERRAIGDWAMAARHYRAHVTTHPADFDIWVQLGHALKETGRLDEADAAYRSAESLRSDDADLLLCRGHLAKLRGDLEAAADLYDLSFAVDGNPAAARELGQLSARWTEIAPPEMITLAGALDGFADGIVTGWAIDPQTPDLAAEVEILVDGQVVASGMCDLDRPEIMAAGLARRRAIGFEIDLSGAIDLARPTALMARLAGSKRALADCPLIVEVPKAYRDWSRRWERLAPEVMIPLIARIEAEAPPLTLGLVVTVTGDGDGLSDLIASLDRQWCGRWEAVFVREDGADLILPKAISIEAADDARLRVVAPDGFGTAPPLLRALETTTAEYVALITSESVLEPEAVWRILDAGARGGDVVYWDEAVIGPSPEGIERFIARPGFSVDHFTAFPGLVGSFALKRDTAIALVGSKGAPASKVVDWLKAMAISKAKAVAHIPTVIERRRYRPEIEPPARATRPKTSFRNTASNSGRTLVVLSPDVTARNLRPTVQAILAASDRDRTGLIIVSADGRSASIQRYLEGLGGAAQLRSCAPDGRASQALNDAIAEVGATYETLILVDAPISPTIGWLDALLARLVLPDVGTVAPILYSADRRVISAGLGLTPSGLVHSHWDQPLMTRRSRSLGWNRSLVSPREQSAAAGCLAIRTASFSGVGGLDTTMSSRIAFADLCLRLGVTGRRTLIDPRAPVRSTRCPETIDLDPAFRARWAKFIAEGDPFLSRLGPQQAPPLDTVFSPAQVRATRPALRPIGTGRFSILADLT